MKQWYIVIFSVLTICFGGMIMNAQAQGLRQAEIVKPAERDPALWATAVCNDGTPFAFTFDASPTGSTNWVIHLEGGGACSGIGEDCGPFAEPRAHDMRSLSRPRMFALHKTSSRMQSCSCCFQHRISIPKACLILTLLRTA